MLSPKRVSAIAVPPASPGYQASRMAVCALGGVLQARALPFIRTMTKRFARGRERGDELLLAAGSSMLRPVAAVEAIDVNRHLFAFKFGAEAEKEKNYIGVPGSGDSLPAKGVERRLPVEGESRAEEGRIVRVFDPDCMGQRVREGQIEGRGGRVAAAGCCLPEVVDQLSVEPHADGSQHHCRCCSEPW